MKTTIQKWGNSHAVRLPKPILESLSLKEKDKVEIVVENDSIIIKKTTRKRYANKSLEKRFANNNDNHPYTEYSWSEPVGKEIW